MYRSFHLIGFEEFGCRGNTISCRVNHLLTTCFRFVIVILWKKMAKYLLLIIHFTVEVYDCCQKSMKAERDVERFARVWDCWIPSFNLTQAQRSDEMKRQICFPVHIFHYSDDTTLRVHLLSVAKRLFLPTRISRIGCCELITNDSWNRGSK